MEQYIVNGYGHNTIEPEENCIAPLFNRESYSCTNQFGNDWDVFCETIDQFTASKKLAELQYNGIIRVANLLKDEREDNEVACYYFMAAILCLLFYKNENTTAEEEVWARKNGQGAIRKAMRLLEDEEFTVIGRIFDILLLKQTERDYRRLYDKCIAINKTCPHIESIENTLITVEMLRNWWNETYYGTLHSILWTREVDQDYQLSIDLANTIKNWSNEYAQLSAIAKLADANFGTKNYDEAERYAIIGKDRMTIEDYKHNKDWKWELCWTIYAKCQEYKGEKDFAFTIYEKGANIGIPMCMEELARMYEQGEVTGENDKQLAKKWRSEAQKIYNS